MPITSRIFLISKQMTLTTTHRLTIDFGQAEIYIIYKVIISFTIKYHFIEIFPYPVSNYGIHSLLCIY